MLGVYSFPSISQNSRICNFPMGGHFILSNVALSSKNIEIEGICSLVGNPLDNEEFSKAYKKSFLGSFNRYSSLSNERLFSIKPSFIERWLYIDGVPC